LIAAQTRKDSAKLEELVALIDSNDSDEKIRGEVYLNNTLVWIGEDAGKKVNYRIVDNLNEVDAVVEEVRRMLRTSAFNPLKYISAE
jgi:hypothetical protein